MHENTKKLNLNINNEEISSQDLYKNSFIKFNKDYTGDNNKSSFMNMPEFKNNFSNSTAVHILFLFKIFDIFIILIQN